MSTLQLDIVAPASTRRHRPRPPLAAAVLLASLLVSIPCFWQPRIQAGDLSSHVYNAWLAQLIERGQAPGLRLARQSSNILFDLLLSGLLRTVGPGPAQRIAVCSAVLVFFWGAFAFVWSSSRQRPRRPPWSLAPCLAMLAYGWVYHMGLFNFYISLGLCFAALALGTRRGRWAAAAIPLLALAWVAHAVPVAWAAALLAYFWMARALAPRYRLYLCAAALAGLGAVALFLYAHLESRWSAGQFMGLTGADQVWVFGVHYIPLAVALLAVWLWWFQRILDTRGAGRTVLDIRFQLCLLCAACVVLIPGVVLLPGMRHTLNAIAERMSLATGVMFCGLAASLRPRRGEIAALAVIAALFFGFLYADERALNQVETRMAGLVARIPPGQRVVSGLADPNSRVNSMAHLVDRACLGRCFSYANYEPSTAQFRVRAERANPIVVWDYAQSWGMQAGGYVVQPRDLPLYAIDLCHPTGSALCIAPLTAGVRLRNTWMCVGPVFGKWDKRHDWR
jgi:hypothetical protein